MNVDEMLDSLAARGYTQAEIAFARNAVAGMNDLSLLVLDIACNSIAARSHDIYITICETHTEISVSVKDDGIGIPPDKIHLVTDIGYTTRQARRMGIGLPLFSLTARRTGGSFSIESSIDANHGTSVNAVFKKASPLCPPIGDMTSTVVSIVAGLSGSHLLFVHTLTCGNRIVVDTHDIAEALHGVSLDSPLALRLVGDYTAEQYKR